MKIFEADVLFAQLLGNEPHHTFPLTKDDHLLVTTLNDVADNVHHLVHLGIVEIFVAYRRSLVVGDDMAVAEEVERPEAEFYHHRDEFGAPDNEFCITGQHKV